MTNGELIQHLKDCPKDLPVRLVIPSLNPDDEENFWVCGLEIHHTGESGYEEQGEIIITGEE